MRSREEVIAKAKELADAGQENDARALLDMWKSQQTAQPAQPAQAAPQPTGDPMRGSFSEGMMGGARSALQGITFGFSDEIVGGLRGMLPGYNVDEEIEREREALRRHRADYPASAIIGETAGGLGTGAYTGAKLGVNTLKGAAALGAAEGGLYGAGVGEDAKERAIGAGLGGAGGAALGLALPAAGSAFQWGRNLMRGAKSKADLGTGRILNATGAEPEELAVQRELMGRDEAVLADVDPRLSGVLAEAAGGADVRTRQELQAQMEQRARDRFGRMADLAEEEFGPGNYQQTLDSIKASRQAEASGLYNEAFDVGVDMTEPALKALTSRPSLKGALKQANTYAKEEGGVITGNAQRLHYAKMALDDQIAKAKGNKKRQLIQTKEELVTWMDDNMPGYSEARGIYADSFSNQRALDDGAQMFKGQFEGDELTRKVQNFSQSEMDNFRVGAKRAFLNRMEEGGGALTKKQEAVMNRLFGEQWPAMKRQLTGEAQMSATERAVARGGKGALDPSDRLSGRVTAGLGMGSPGVAAGGLAEMLMRKLTNLPPEAQGRIAKRLADPNITEQEIRRLMETVDRWSEGARRATPGALGATVGFGVSGAGVLQE